MPEVSFVNLLEDTTEPHLLNFFPFVSFTLNLLSIGVTIYSVIIRTTYDKIDISIYLNIKRMTFTWRLFLKTELEILHLSSSVVFVLFYWTNLYLVKSIPANGKMMVLHL